MELILATRKSKLAQTQTETVMAMLKEKHKIDAKKLLVVTEGDKRLDVTLDKIGGKGLSTNDFTNTYKTKLDAMNAEREFLNSKVEFGGDMDMTFGTLTDQYIESQKNKVRRRTMETYLKRRRYFTDFENVKLKDMDGNLYHKFQQDLWNKPIKCSTRNDVQKFLKIILNWGMKMYDINLMKFYKKIEFFKDPNEMKVEKDVYTFEEFQKYITGTTNLNDKAMFEMLYYCGLRRGEARGLQWSDIDWNNKLVSITKQANSVKDSQKYYELTPPKTSKSIRTLPLTDVLYNDLVDLYNEKKKYYGFNDKWFIFGEYDPLTFGMMSRINGRIAKNADIRRIPLHSFRHSCASLLINTGQPVTTVSKYLGHASTKETLDTYAHMFPNNLTNVKNTIDNLNLGI